MAREYEARDVDGWKGGETYCIRTCNTGDGKASDACDDDGDDSALAGDVCWK